MRRTIIFVPGFKGSRLVNEKGTLIWPNFWRAQCCDHTSLHLSLPELNLGNTEHYHAQDIVDTVTLLPAIYHYSIYGKWMRFLDESFSKNSSIFYYPYDWRQDLRLISEQLTAFVNHTIEKESDEIILIGHSMGGLIISDVLRRLNHPSAIKKIFFVSTPFEGSLKALLYLMHGNAFGLNNTLLSKKAMATFPSVYYLLPRYAQAIEHEISISFETLEKYSLGFLMQSANGRAYVHQQMERRAYFYEELKQLNGRQANTELIFIHNRSINTPFSLALNTHHIEQTQGDGTVAACSLAIPAYFSKHDTKQHDITQQHTTSFADKHLFALILKYLK